MTVRPEARIEHSSAAARYSSATGEGPWINSEPLDNAALRGKVIALHFWTFGCSNCIQNYPWRRQWQEQFMDRPFLQLGVYTPELDHERNIERIREVVQREQCAFPVVVDNDKQICRAWSNGIWPAVYLHDRQGQIGFRWYGELNWQGVGGQETMSRRMEDLLQEAAPATLVTGLCQNRPALRCSNEAARQSDVVRDASGSSARE